MITFTKGIAEIRNGKKNRRLEGYCLAKDVKPTDVANGSTLIEMDTGKIYMFDKESDTWLEWGGTP